jgi:chaperonin GroES
MSTNITPLHDRVILRRIEEGEQVRGGIIIPDSAKEKPQEGEVIAVGEGKRREDGERQPLDVKAGDRVLFGKYSGSEIKLDGEEFLIMREDRRRGRAVARNIRGLLATSRTMRAPRFSSGSLRSISLATDTPSFVMVGEPNFLSSTTLRPFGPRVILTASASWLTPRRIAARDSSP